MNAPNTAEVIELRARRDRNRLLGTYDPVRRMLRLFHRGETITLDLARLEGGAKPPEAPPSTDQLTC